MGILSWLFGPKRAAEVKPEVKEKSKAELVADSIASEFLSGKIIHRNLNTHGVSSLRVNWEGVEVSISWYSGIDGSLSDFRIGSRRSFSKHHTKTVLRAAKDRAARLTEEDLNSFASRIPAQGDTQ